MYGLQTFGATQSRALYFLFNKNCFTVFTPLQSVINCFVLCSSKYQKEIKEAQSENFESHCILKFKYSCKVKIEASFTSWKTYLVLYGDFPVVKTKIHVYFWYLYLVTYFFWMFCVLLFLFVFPMISTCLAANHGSYMRTHMVVWVAASANTRAMLLSILVR